MSKVYLSHTPNSGYIDKGGVRHIFTQFGKLGRLVTDNPDLQKEMDAAIRTGAPFRAEDGSVVPALTTPSAIQVAAEALEATHSAELAELRRQLAAATAALEAQGVQCDDVPAEGAEAVPAEVASPAQEALQKARAAVINGAVNSSNAIG